jgi:hypothetical protein
MPLRLFHSKLLGNARLPDAVAKRAAEVILAGLRRQAAAGLAPAKEGGQVTLQGKPQTREIWETAEPRADGSILFRSPVAFLLEEYGGAELRGRFRDEVARELTQILQAGIEVG